MDSWWHFLWGCLVAWLIYWLTFLLFGIMISAVGSQVTMILSRVPIDTSTLRFSVSSFLALFGSSLLHLYMDSVETSYMSRNYDRNIDMPAYNIPQFLKYAIIHDFTNLLKFFLLRTKILKKANFNSNGFEICIPNTHSGAFFFIMNLIRNNCTITANEIILDNGLVFMTPFLKKNITCLM